MAEYLEFLIRLMGRKPIVGKVSHILRVAHTENIRYYVMPFWVFGELFTIMEYHSNCHLKSIDCVFVIVFMLNVHETCSC